MLFFRFLCCFNNYITQLCTCYRSTENKKTSAQVSANSDFGIFIFFCVLYCLAIFLYKKIARLTSHHSLLFSPNNEYTILNLSNYKPCDQIQLLFSLMFTVILSTVSSLMYIYACQRIYSIPLIRNSFSKKLFNATVYTFWIFFFISLIIGHDGSGPFSEALEFFAMNFLGTLFLITTFLLLTELLTGFGLFFKSASGNIRGGGIIIALLLSLFALTQGLQAPVISPYEITLTGLPSELDQTVLVAVSDLHLGSQLNETWLKKRIDQIKTLNPDLVVLIGDTVEGHNPIPNSISMQFQSLNPPLGLWAVTGNHEFFRGMEKNIHFFNKSHISLLRNRWAEIKPGLIIAGVDDLTYAKRLGSNKNLITKTLANHPPGALILLSHSPWQAEQAAKLGTNLMLSGHTHDGQIWPFNYLVRQFYPLIAGYYKIGSMQAVISRGTGTWGPRMRLWKRGEILQITLRAEQKILKY